MKPVALQSFLGMNNLLPAEKLSTKEGAFVRSAVNVDVTDAGTLKRRQGTEQSLAGAECHSFWTHRNDAFMVDGSTLYRLSETPLGLSKTALATVTPGLQFSYTSDGREVRASNGVEALRITGNTVSPWAVPTPRYQPLLVAGQGGSLPAGQVRVCVSYMDAAGEEGATTQPVAAFVGENGALTITGIPHEAGYTTLLYATQPNDDQFFKIGEPAGTTVAMALKPSEGPRPAGLMLAPMPAGHIVRYLNGRLLVAAGNMLYYSETYQLGLYDPNKNFIPFPEPITMVEPCQNGFYLSADQTYWIDGNLPQADLNPVLPYKAVLGTSGPVPNTNSVWWMSERGTILGTQDGQVQNLQEKNVAVDPAVVGASLFREQDGMKQMVSSLFSPQSTVIAASSFMDAEIVRKETQL